MKHAAVITALLLAVSAVNAQKTIVYLVAPAKSIGLLAKYKVYVNEQKFIFKAGTYAKAELATDSVYLSFNNPPLLTKNSNQLVAGGKTLYFALVFNQNFAGGGTRNFVAVTAYEYEDLKAKCKREIFAENKE